MSSPILLFVGAGGNVGTSVVKKFAAAGWKTAAVVRTMKDEYKNLADVVIHADFGDAAKLSEIYKVVSNKLGTPNCVVYNAFSMTAAAPDASKPFSFPAAALATDLAHNTVSMYAVASAAAAGFETLPAGAPRAFIYTGNMCNTLIVPEQGGLGAGKNASAYLLETAANCYEASHWYYADERLPNGRPVMTDISGEAHAEAFYGLAVGKEQGPWDYTFVKGVGYRKFPTEVSREFTPIGTLMAEIGK